MPDSNILDTYSSGISMQNNFILPPLSTTDGFIDWMDELYKYNTNDPKDKNDASMKPININQNASSFNNDDTNIVSPLLWVPADRHPEIAPSEFTKWLESNGSNIRTTLRRKSSVLSQIHMPSDDEETTLEFDRHSSAQDTSRVLAGGNNGSLLRRSAFSARGRSRKLTSSRHGDHVQQQTAIKEPVRLYDRPVSMNEWIDLGSASILEDGSGILSRVHDAESHILPPLDHRQTPPLHKNTTLQRTIPIKDTTLSSSPIPERHRKSWFGGFFSDNKKHISLRREDEGLKKSSLVSLFSRTKSTVTNNHKHQHDNQPQQLLLSLDGPRLPIHVERAIYRLSHHKLANPRRPLHHQVAISNLMFWYLSVINTPSHQLQHHHQLKTIGNHKQSPIILSTSNTPSKFHAHFDDSPRKEEDDDLPLSYYK
ncbi:activator of mitotic machinery Cdc14 phosphatase activation C-term-domain-containing protein [Chlamydoabsidia padenii]|nr:activator of mitotic machinery Cdc14 phosphatase activation C-term-domain-containing protein [Chlamydoabsidia padenii]